MQSVPAPPFEPEIIDPLLDDRVNHASFETFFEATSHEVKSLLTLALLDERTAAEAATEAYALALHRWQDVSSQRHPAGWVFRAGLAHAFASGAHTHLAPSADDDLDLFEALTELYQQQRALIALRMLGAWTDEQIRGALGLTDEVGREVTGVLDQLRFRLPGLAEEEVEERLRGFFDRRHRSTVPVDLASVRHCEDRLGRRRRLFGAGLAAVAILIGAALLATASSSPDVGQVDAAGRGTFPGESVPATSTPETSPPPVAAPAMLDLEWKRVHWEFGITEFTAVGDGFIGIDGPDQIDIRPTGGNPSVRISSAPFAEKGADLIVGQDAIAAASGEFFETLDIATLSRAQGDPGQRDPDPRGSLSRYTLPPVELDAASLPPQVFSFQVIHADGTLVVARIGESTEVFAGPIGGVLEEVDLGRQPGPFFDLAASNGWFVLRDFERESLRSRDGITWEKPPAGVTAPFSLVSGGVNNPIVGFVNEAIRPAVLKYSADGGETWPSYDTPFAAPATIAAVGDVIVASGLDSMVDLRGDQAQEFMVTVRDSGYTLRLQMNADDSGDLQVVDNETGIVVLDQPTGINDGIRFQPGVITFFEPGTGDVFMTLTNESISRAFLIASGALEDVPMTIATAAVPNDKTELEWGVAPITQDFGADARFVDFVAGNGALLAVVTTDDEPRLYVASIGRAD